MLVKLILKVAVVVIGALLGIVGILYVADYGLSANVVATECPTSGPFGGGGAGTVTVEVPLLLNYEHTVSDIPALQCNAVQSGNHVVYHLRSGRTALYESDGGQCIYDSVGGIGGCDA